MLSTFEGMADDGGGSRKETLQNILALNLLISASHEI